jgi:Uma2 family endonuclease
VSEDTAFVSSEIFAQEAFRRWLLHRPASDPHGYELIRGRIVMTPPAGWPHGQVEARIVSTLTAFVDPRGPGIVLGSSAGYELPSGDTVKLDVSFISQGRLAAGPTPVAGEFVRVVPNLVVEILSPTTARYDRTEKKVLYEENGVEEYWLVDPGQQEVTVFHLLGDRYDGGERLTVGETLSSRVLAGFTVEVRPLFP